jgi:hypothetical protein
MRLKTTVRILSDIFRRRNLRETYWEAAKAGGYLVKLLDSSNKPFATVVARDMRRFVWGGGPSTVDDRRRESAAVEWILSAQNAAGRGVSLGYFPCGDSPAWQPPYPETTGYIISSLLRYAERKNREVVRKRALDMAAWEVEIQMPSGAVQGGPYIPSIDQTPCAFNTGMVLDGWCSAYQITRDPKLFHAAHRAAEYLIGDLSDEGYFRTNGRFVSSDKIKTYTCLCAWSMYRFGELAGEARYRIEAVRSVEAAIRQQDANGWFANNCLTRPEAPLLHTIGYTLQGILEVGILAGRNDFIHAVRLGVDPLLSRISTDGFLNGRFYSDWMPASFSCCLTGSAQLAVVCYRLYQHTGEPNYRRFGDLLLNFLKPLQWLDSECTPVNGAIAGCFPIFGEYMTGGYPNWATKYFLDALMLQDDLRSAFEPEAYAVDSIC